MRSKRILNIVMLLVLAASLLPATVVAAPPGPGSVEGAPAPASGLAISTAAPSASTPLAPSQPMAPVDLVLDDGTNENTIGIGNSGIATQFIWMNRFTPSPADFPFDLEEIWVSFANTDVPVGGAVDLVVYEDTDGDGDPSDATVVAVYNDVVQYNDGTWSEYTLSPPTTLNGPGDVLIGVINRYIDSGVSPQDHPAALDQTTSAERSWVGWYTVGDVPDPPVLPPDEAWGTMDSFGYPGNWLIRGYGDSGTQLGLDLIPPLVEVVGCAGVEQIHTFELYNATGVDDTFDLTYDVPSGNGTLTGPADLFVADGAVEPFDVELTPDECLPAGTEVIATIDAAGSTVYTAEAVITKTISLGMDQWLSAANTPQATGYHAVAYHDGAVYHIGGAPTRWVPTSQVNQYDIATDSWTTVAPMPTGAYLVDAVTIGDLIYLPGGSDDNSTWNGWLFGGTFLDSLQIYDPVANTWSTGAAMPAPLAGASAVAYGGLLYVAGGLQDDGTATDSLYIYDPGTDSWSVGASMAMTRSVAAAAAIGGQIYVAGGYVGANGGDYAIDSVEIYDIGTDTWSAGPALPDVWAPYGDGAFADRYFIVYNGGSIHSVDGYYCSQNAIWYDTMTGLWDTLPDLPRCIYASQGVSTGNRFYQVNGRTNEGGSWHMAPEVEYLEGCPPCQQTGWLDGYVMDSETGDVDPTCTDASVTIDPGGLVVPVDVNGYYWTDLYSGTYTVEATAPGYSVESEVVDITTDMTTTQDFNLWRPVISITPTDFISVPGYLNITTTYPLVITNSGHLPLEFEIYEEAGLPPLTAAARSYKPAPAAEGVDPTIYAEMADAADGKTEFFVAFQDTADLAPAYAMSWSERGQFVVNALKATAQASQANVAAWLEARGIEYTSFWINNTLFVRADEATLNELATFPEVAGFRANHIYEITPAEAPSGEDAAPTAPAYPWNITFPMADQVHTQLGITGEGVVIGGMDTGVDYDHIGLVNNYRGNLGGGNFDHTYSWSDPENACGGTPCDTDTHGTSTMGIMAGDDDPSLPDGAWIGMAPDAEWIHCVGCPNGSCPTSATTACAQWFLAPGGDPDMRPQVVNHSWGTWSPDDCNGNAYQAELMAYRAADIVPAFAAGNVGDYVTPPHCYASTSPANNTDPSGNPIAFSSGAVGSSGTLDYYSSGGPSACNNDNLFPDVTSPGSGSCTTGLNDTYNCSFGGTSSASPHTAGCVALVRSANPTLTVDEVEQAIRDAANDVDDGCGTPAETPDWNNLYGEGHLDCYEAVAETMMAADLPWVWEDPVTGTIPGPDAIEITVSFLCTETRDYTGTLRIVHNDPCEEQIYVPIQLHCQQPAPEPYIAKTAEPEYQIVGGVVTYTIMYGNNGYEDAVGVVISDVLPAEVGGGELVLGPMTLAAQTDYVETVVVTIAAGVEPFTWITNTAYLYFEQVELEASASHYVTATVGPLVNYYYLPIILKNN